MAMLMLHSYNIGIAIYMYIHVAHILLIAIIATAIYVTKAFPSLWGWLAIQYIPESVLQLRAEVVFSLLLFCSWLVYKYNCVYTRLTLRAHVHAYHIT